MKTQPKLHLPLCIWILTLIAMLALSSCRPSPSTTLVSPTEPTATMQPLPPTTSPTQAATATQSEIPPTRPVENTAHASTEPATTEPTGAQSSGVSLDIKNVAESQTLETIPAVLANSGAPLWEVLPEHRVLTLRGYPITNHLMQPQIFIYPVAELAGSNEAAANIAAGLQTLLQSQQPADQMPFLPLFNAAQVLHAQDKFLDFKNGKGVRFLTQFDQAFMPVNNYELFYTFQGLTNDGKYYVAAILPVTHPDLPAGQQVDATQTAEMSDFATYLANTTDALNQAPPDSFLPDLGNLDAMIQSLEVK